MSERDELAALRAENERLSELVRTMNDDHEIGRCVHAIENTALRDELARARVPVLWLVASSIFDTSEDATQYAKAMQKMGSQHAIVRSYSLLSETPISSAQALREKLRAALEQMMSAFERRVRSSCTTPDALAKEPWKCAEWIQAEEALRLPLLFSNEWLRKKIADDPCDEPSAGDIGETQISPAQATGEGE